MSNIEHTAMKKPLLVRAEWDPEAGVWVATSDEVPGLVTEAETAEALVEKLKGMIPELLATNRCAEAEEEEYPFELLVRRFEVAYRNTA